MQVTTLVVPEIIAAGGDEGKDALHDAHQGAQLLLVSVSAPQHHHPPAKQ
jgi:hypothetical protein